MTQTHVKWKTKNGWTKLSRDCIGGGEGLQELAELQQKCSPFTISFQSQT